MLRMIVLLLQSLGLAQAAFLMWAAPCPGIDSQSILDHGANATVVVESGPGRPMLHMELYAEARALVTVYARTATVVVMDCTSGRVGLAFAEYGLGMDCGQAMTTDIMSKVDALDTTQGQTVKMVHLLSHLDKWRTTRACEQWTARWPAVGAAIFWAFTGGAFFAGRACVERIGAWGRRRGQTASP